MLNYSTAVNKCEQYICSENILFKAENYLALAKCYDGNGAETPISGGK